MKKNIFVRLVRVVPFSLFNNVGGQKTYWSSRFRKTVAYSPGQQIKRSIMTHLLEELGEASAPLKFIRQVTNMDGENTRSEQKNIWQPCDPSYTDQLIGGYMYTMQSSKGKKGKKKSEDNADQEGDETEAADRTYKRRSPLSIGAFTPIHPLLADTPEEGIMTFDRRDDPNSTVAFIDKDGNSIEKDELISIILNANQPPSKLSLIGKKGEKKKRVDGIFSLDVCIDLSRLFSVSIMEPEPEVSPEVQKKLRDAGWKDSKTGVPSLIAPKEVREKIINSLPEALFNWKIDSNQARNFGIGDTIAIAISQNANHIVNTLRADINYDENGNEVAEFVVDDEVIGDGLFVSKSAGQERINYPNKSGLAVDNAMSYLQKLLSEYHYEAQ